MALLHTLVTFFILFGQNGFWIDVPFIPQGENGCGIASALMILKYWDEQLPGETQTFSAAEIEAEIDFDVRKGVRGSDLTKLLESKGFRVFLFNGAWADLKHHVQKGRPLIVCLDGGGSAIPLHFVVVIGYENSPEFLLVNDPARRKAARIERSRLEARWQESEHWTLLAVPADD